MDVDPCPSLWLVVCRVKVVHLGTPLLIVCRQTTLPAAAKDSIFVQTITGSSDVK